MTSCSAHAGFQLRSMLLLVLLNFAACQPEGENLAMDELEHFAERYAAAWSSQDADAFAAFYAEDGQLQINDGEPSVGRAAIAATARDFMAGFPDMVIELVEVRRDGDYVIFEWRWTGTNTGPGGTGNAVDLTGFEQWTLGQDGLILQSLGHLDEEEYARQLNAGSAAE